MAIKRFILIRPGETDWNRNGRWQGWVAVPLNAHGRNQAEMLAMHLRNIGPGALYSSDLRRAVDTAEIVGEKLGLKPVYDKRLRERNIGQWQGLTLTEMQAWYPDEWDRLHVNPEAFQVPGGESRREVRSRVLAAFEDISARGGGETVAVVCHTTATHLLLEKLVPGYDMYATSLANSSVTTVARDDDDSWRIVVLNDLLHLEGLEARYVRELEEDDDSSSG